MNARRAQGAQPVQQGGAGRLNPAVVFLVVAVGGACSVGWVLHADTPLMVAQARAFDWWLAPVGVALTCASVALRFLRWHYFLRRVGVRLQTRRSAGIFVAGLAMLLTPAYAGEGIKAWLASQESPRGYARTGAVVVAERLFDAAALALIGGGSLLLAGDSMLGLSLLAGAGAGVLGLALLLALAARRPALAARLGPLAGVGAPDLGLRVLPVALVLSLGAWVLGSLTLFVVCAGVGFSLSPLEAVATYALATLLGGLTLLPAGVGVVGTAILVRLVSQGASLQQATLAAVLVRLLTVWITAGAGIAGSWLVWRRFQPAAGARRHFEALAPEYAGELSATARTRVLRRKMGIALDALARAAVRPGARVLDAGCGRGWYLEALLAAGYRVTGLDLAAGQLREARALVQGQAAARTGGATWAAGSVLRLPFAAGSFDAVLVTNVLHHVGGGQAQRAALAELAHVVRPGGVVLLNEISTVNPAYRLYMAYLFPLWKRIDVGTEHWLDPRDLPLVAAADLQSVTHYTFLPDFTPGPLYRWLEPVEARLERSGLARLAAHFTAVYRRRGARAEQPRAPLAVGG